MQSMAQKSKHGPFLWCYKPESPLICLEELETKMSLLKDLVWKYGQAENGEKDLLL